MTMDGDGEAKRLGGKLLVDVEVEGLGSVGWNLNDGFQVLMGCTDTQLSSCVGVGKVNLA